jgi:predicted heme/steroid binding protein
MSERTFTEDELRQYHGEGVPMYIAAHGVVYDVTNCPKWRRGIHENLHWPGQNLTDELNDAPHDNYVFTHTCVKRVGILISA